MKKIVFIVNTTFNKRDYHRFGIEILKNKGYEVEVWDSTPLLNPNYYRNYTPSKPIYFDKYFLVYKKNHIEKLISKLSDKDIAVCLIPIMKQTAFIFGELSKKCVKYGFVLAGHLPHKKNSFIDKILLAFKNPQIVLQKILSKFTMNNICINPANFFIVGGREAVHDGQYKIDEHTKIIKAHAFDYDRYLEAELDHLFERKDERYAVFLDEFVPFHPDRFIAHNKISCTPEKYYPPLCEFFRHLENELKLKVIIAAHPRSSYNMQSNPFGDREIIFSKTIQLVKHSLFVLAHTSTAINFAVLYQKPIIFLFHPAYRRSYREFIKHRASVFEKNPIDLSKPFPLPQKLKKELEHNYSSYKEYKSMFIKETGTPEKPIWEIFADYCEHLSM